MDLIYTNANREDVGVLQDFELDLAFGKDENDFELTVDSNNDCCISNGLIYIENTEYGGIVDKLKVKTKDEALTYCGRTWSGVLGSKILEPDEGQAYLIISGEANSVISSLIDRIGLSGLFKASEDNSSINIESFKFDRYTDAYSGIIKMLSSVSGKLKFKFINGKVEISALPSVDYSEEEQFDNDSIEMDIEKAFNTVNHLICLGKGELTERTVIHLYADAEGNISENQTFKGLEEITASYDYSNAESPEALKEKGIEKLKEYISEGKVEMDFDENSDNYDIGDYIGSREIKTGISVKEKIAKKIVKISKNEINIEYKVGE
jgi:hypothetical protein